MATKVPHHAIAAEARRPQPETLAVRFRVEGLREIVEDGEHVGQFEMLDMPPPVLVDGQLVEQFMADHYPQIELDALQSGIASMLETIYVKSIATVLAKRMRPW